ncbi:MAG: peptidoglycan editing factor PgeF [Oscillospiraceae bacterium]|nr:peptidoglycan editing factor PgeF [Oscillospiraceae bacterium]
MSVREVTAGELRYLRADLLAGTRHCFTTRLGGVSADSLASLNLGVHRGDDPACVLENYRRLGRAIGFTPEQTVFTRQMHTDCIRQVGKADRGLGLFGDMDAVCDGFITNEPGVALTVFTADCTPILLYDPVRRAICACHSGWRGTAMGIVKKAVAAMTAAYGTSPADVRAAIGPCIGRCCFETDRDVPDAMIAALGERACAPLLDDLGGGRYRVDLKAINREWLLRAGLPADQIETSPLCTACRQDLFWSHRRLGNARGSMAAVIMLPEKEFSL